MRDLQLAEALQECQEYAQFGYDFANKSYREIHKTLKKARKKLQETDRKQSYVDRIANSAVIARERENVEALQRMDEEILDNLDTLLERQKEFSIVVFGRTMAGKSTLMEILTHGNGESIGKGAQRTTRDVREYRWKGMKVTDVPGICSFDGREDDALAMKAAKAADLIIFLITDDAPQDSEAEKLAELKDLGKNVLGVINVKLGLNMSRRKMALRDLTKKMNDTARIDEICNQFRAYGERYDQDWRNLSFVETHLQAAYLGKDDPELYELSNFDAVEEYILNKVQSDACFLRMKTFIDNVSKPLSDHIASVLDDETETVDTAFTYRKKWHELDDWHSGFFDETQDKYYRFMQRLREQVNEAIVDFAEDNYENQNAGEAWKTAVAAMHLERQCQSFLKERAEVCNRKRQELADEFATEIRFSSKVNANSGKVDMEDITDFSSLFGGAAAVTALIPGIGWGVSIGLLLLSLFSDSKQKQIREAKETLRNKLHEVMDPVMDKIGDQVVNLLNEEILQKGIGGFRQSLVDMDEMFFELAATQGDLAYDLKWELQKANALLWEMSLHIAGLSEDDTPKNKYTENCRIPGKAFVIIMQQRLLNQIFARVMELWDEPVHIVWGDPEDEDELVALMDQWLGKDEWMMDAFPYDSENDKKVYYTHILSDDINEDSVNYRLAQQLFSQPILRY